MGAFLIDKDAQFFHTDNEDSYQIAQMHRLIGVFVGRSCPKVRFRTSRLKSEDSLMAKNNRWISTYPVCDNVGDINPLNSDPSGFNAWHAG